MNWNAIKVRSLLLPLLIAPMLLWAQSSQETPESKTKTNKNLAIEIRKLEITTEKTPAAKGSQKGSRGSGARWLCVRGQINISDQQWLDEIDARWSVLVDTGSKSKPILMQLSTKFVNLEKGKNYITAFVNPNFFKRHLDTEKVSTSKVSARLEIAVNGKVVARKQEGGKAGLIATPGKCSIDKSSLVPRSKTPFADVDFDHYANEKAD